MKKLILILSIILTAQIVFAQASTFPIVPTPKIIKPIDGFFQLQPKLSISNAFDNENDYTIELIKKTLKEFDGITSVTKPEGEIQISYIKNDETDHVVKNMSDEGYVLRITKNNIELKSKSAKGIYYAAMSLIQLLEKAEGKIKCAEIIDWPDMKIRGISDDISRGQVSNTENFKRIISHIARYKMNTYLPYMEDMLEFDQYPSIGKGRGALTKSEVKEILKFAKMNFVEIIPIFQTLGHYENILAKKEFLPYAEFPGSASLNVSNDSTYIFLENLLKEVFDLFPSEYFHMGADESWDVGLGASKKLVEQSNIAAVHANHYKRVYNICKKYNKKVMMYGDILLDYPEILSLIPKDITIVDWHYNADSDYPSVKIIKDAGFEYLVSPSAWNFVSTFPVNVLSLPNIKYLIKAGLDNDAKGMINSNWGDYGAETFKEFILFNYAWSAQCAWDYDQSSLELFTNNYFYDFWGIRDSHLIEIYKVLSNSLNQVTWHEVWRHPLLKFKEPVWWEPRISKAARITWNEFSNTGAFDYLELLKSKVRKNKDHIELLQFICRFHDWYNQKLQTQIFIQEYLQNSSAIVLPALISKIDDNINALMSLKNEYKNQWLKYYKPANLNMIEDKFSRLISYFSEIKEEALSQNLNNFDPLLPSKWLYYKINDSTYAQSAEFTASFEISSGIEEAVLQLIGDTYVKLYINEKFVDEVFARHSLSLLVDYDRIKMIDIKPYLHQGKNTIRITAQNYNQNRGAGFNLIGFIKSKDEKMNIMTDESDNAKIKWFARKLNSNDWKQASSKPYWQEIIAPNFETNRSSWIER